ncbi:hypothetical protein BH11BAC5_BH11BAC5_12060 [soil metagenome]
MKKIDFGSLIALLFCVILLVNCKKEKSNPASGVPVLTTDSVTNVGFNVAKVHVNITSDGGSAITARGVCWSTSSAPTINNSMTNNGAGTGSFVSELSSLINNTKYYLRSYSTNTTGTAYGNELNFTTAIPGDKIDTTAWMLHNLDVVTYANGDIIPEIKDQAVWNTLTTGAWCYYNNDSTNNSSYGKLYNWYAVNDQRGLAPTGWHIASKDDWSAMVNSLGGDPEAGGKLKSLNLWLSPNTGATNITGFNGTPAGYRSEFGYFAFMGANTIWWTSKEHDATTAVERSLGYDYKDCYMFYYDKHCGMSVRCIRN